MTQLEQARADVLRRMPHCVTPGCLENERAVDELIRIAKEATK